MAAPTKTQATSLLAIRTIANLTSVVGTVIDVSTKFSGVAYVHFGRTVTTALTNAMQFRLEGSSHSTLDGHWFPLYQWQSGVAAAVAPTATGGGTAGSASITVTNTSMFPGALLFCQNGTIANSEWVRVATQVSTTSITLEDNLVVANASSVITSQAEEWAIPLDFSGVGRVRLVCSSGIGSVATGVGVTTAAEAYLTTLDTIA